MHVTKSKPHTKDIQFTSRVAGLTALTSETSKKFERRQPWDSSACRESENELEGWHLLYKNMGISQIIVNKLMQQKFCGYDCDNKSK